MSCNNQHKTKGADISGEDKINIDTTSYLTECESVEDTTYRETLNEIRFAGWTRKEWADNEYIREVRRHASRYNEVYSKYPPARVYVYQERICIAKDADFKKYGISTNMETYAWYIWERGYKGTTELRWISNNKNVSVEIE